MIKRQMSLMQTQQIHLKLNKLARKLYLDTFAADFRVCKNKIETAFLFSFRLAPESILRLKKQQKKLISDHYWTKNWCCQKRDHNFIAKNFH